MKNMGPANDLKSKKHATTKAAKKPAHNVVAKPGKAKQLDAERKESKAMTASATKSKKV